MNTYFERKAEIILSDDAVKRDSYKFVLKLFTLNAEINNIVEKSFQNDFRFKNNVSFRNFINKYSLTSKYMVEYCDIELKKKGNHD